MLSDAYLLRVPTTAIIRIYRSQKELGWVREGLLGKRSFELGPAAPGALGFKDQGGASDLP